tara:strand:+ start:102 stop:533 length:432 start_codon:yes stop_codon:yes gene_type:complete
MQDNEIQDQELWDIGVEDYTWCLFVDDENGDEIFCSGFIFETEEDAFQEGSLFADEFRISVISDFEHNNDGDRSHPLPSGWDFKGLSIFFGVYTWVFFTLASFVFALFVWADSTLPEEPKRYPQGGSGWSTQQLEDLNEFYGE